MTVRYPDIAFIGRAGAGKTTCAEILVKHFGYQRLSFAAPLKVMCGTTTDRGLLQRVGVGVRDLYPDAWVNLLRDKLQGDYPRELADATPFVIDDCRFPNESDMLREEGFKIVRVMADRNVRLARLQANGKLQDEAQLEHESETALDHSASDWRVVNVGDPTMLLTDLTGYLNREAW